MTKEAYVKLNTKQKEYLTTISHLITRARKNGLLEESENNRGKLRGYLECLHQMNVITNTEMRALYLYFATID